MFVRRLHVRVGADHSRNFSIEKPAERNFLARRFAVDIDNDIRGLFTDFGHGCFHGMKRVLQNRLHKRARLHVDHADFSLGRLQHNRSVAGRARRIIHWPEQARLKIKKGDNVFLVPNMIAACHHRHTRA